MSEEERKVIDNKVKASGMTRTDFIIRALEKQPVTVIHNAGEILAELVREGNNLNQAVKYSFIGKANEGELLDCIRQLKQLHATILKTVGGG